MVHPSAEPFDQESFSNFTLTSDPVSRRAGGMVGERSTMKGDQASGYETGKSHLEIGSSGCIMRDMEARSTDHNEIPVPEKMELSGLKGAEKDVLGESYTVVLINDYKMSDPSTLELELTDTFELFESLESPRGSDYDRRAWFDKAQYRAWIGSRNLHVD